MENNNKESQIDILVNQTAALRQLLADEPVILTLSQAAAYTEIPKSTLWRWCDTVPIMTAFGIEFVLGARALQRFLAAKPKMKQASQDIERLIEVGSKHAEGCKRLSDRGEAQPRNRGGDVSHGS